MGNNKTYQKFVLLTYRRTGANYFHDLLRSHKAIVAYAAMYEQGRIGFIYPGYPSPYNKCLLKYRNNYPIDFLNHRIFGNYSHNIKAVGFKIVYETAHPVVFEYLSKQTDVKFIHLQRRNILRLYLSDMIASKLNIWGAVARENENLFKNNKAESFTKVIEKNEDKVLPDDFTIKLDYEDCLKVFIKIKGFVEKYNNYFKPGQVVNLYYEDLLINPDKELEKIQKFLGVDYQKLTSRFIKINNQKLYDVIENYSDLKKRFTGTEWAVFFED